jgi:arylsulfatase A-like enzyme
VAVTRLRYPSRVPSVLPRWLRVALAHCALAAVGCGPTPDPRPWVVLVSLDTLRADHLVPYGYARETSPALARFAAEAVRFDAAHAQATATLPSHLSLLTSRLPPELGITRADGRNDTQARTRLRLADGVETLAEALRLAGYATAAFTDGGFVHPYYGFDQGFESFSVTSLEEGAYRDGFPATIGRVREWLAGHAGDPRPAFLFVHTYDIHEPYAPPRPWATAFTDIPYAAFAQQRGFAARPLLLSQNRESLTARDVALATGFYDNGIRATDARLGELFAVLREAGGFERAIVSVVSDHGEEFLDHGDFGHGPRVYQELARVPWLLRLPEGREGGRVIPRPVALLDLAPTLLDLVGVPAPAGFRGRSLRALLDGRDDGAWLEERPIYVGVPDRRRDVAALRRGPWKLIRDGETGAMQLFHLERDPGETRDLSAEEPAMAHGLSTQLTQWTRQMQRAAAAEGLLAVPSQEPHPSEHTEALRALGYVE